MERSFIQLPARLTLRYGVLFVAVLLCPSCSGGLNKVRGKVLYQGKPIKGAVVALHPKGSDSDSPLNPTGITDDVGVFTLSTQKDSGAPAGEYVVTIVWLAEPAPPTKPIKKPMGTQEGLPEKVDR